MAPSVSLSKSFGDSNCDCRLEQALLLIARVLTGADLIPSSGTEGGSLCGQVIPARLRAEQPAFRSRAGADAGSRGQARAGGKSPGRAVARRLIFAFLSLAPSTDGYNVTIPPERTKTWRTLERPMPAVLVAAMRRYFDHYRSVRNNRTPAPPVWLARSGAQFPADTFADMITKRRC